MSLGVDPEVAAHRARAIAAASALVINMGILDAPWVDAMIQAGKAANHSGIPVILNLVGVGATSFRTQMAERLLSDGAVLISPLLEGDAGLVALMLAFAVSSIPGAGIGYLLLKILRRSSVL